MRRLSALCIVLLVFLAGCATGKGGRAPLDWAQQQSLLASLQGFGISGRAAVRAGEEGLQANVRWNQGGGQSEVELSGPFGAGSLLLRKSANELQVVDSKGSVLSGEDAKEALTRALGFAPPLDALRYWLLAMPDPGSEPVSLQHGDDGTLSAFSQLGWQLRFENYRPEPAPGGTVRMPGRITATREDMRLRLVVDRWRLRPER